MEMLYGSHKAKKKTGSLNTMHKVEMMKRQKWDQTATYHRALLEKKGTTEKACSKHGLIYYKTPKHQSLHLKN
jgi:hypothetical protein